MWKLLFLARRAWKLIPREHRRKAILVAGTQARRHGPVVAKAVGRTVRQARAIRKAR
jgi:hypothetical protein